MIILVDFESCSYEIVNLIPSVMLNALKYGVYMAFRAFIMIEILEFAKS